MGTEVFLDFWRKQPRLRRLPEREIEAEGAAALLTGWESVSSPARLELLVTRNTFDLLSVVRNG